MRLEGRVSPAPRERDRRAAARGVHDRRPRRGVVARLGEDAAGEDLAVLEARDDAEADVVEGPAHERGPMRRALLPGGVDRGGGRAPQAARPAGDDLAPAEPLHRGLRERRGEAAAGGLVAERGRSGQVARPVLGDGRQAVVEAQRPQAALGPVAVREVEDGRRDRRRGRCGRRRGGSQRERERRREDGEDDEESAPRPAPGRSVGRHGGEATRRFALPSLARWSQDRGTSGTLSAGSSVAAARPGSRAVGRAPSSPSRSRAVDPVSDSGRRRPRRGRRPRRAGPLARAPRRPGPRTGSRPGSRRCRRPSPAT